MIERIKKLCIEHKTNFSKLEHELGFANGSLAKSDGKIQSQRLKAIADYFGVTMEYLLTGKDEPEAFWDGPSDAPAMTVAELEILELFRSLPADTQNEVLRYGKFLSQEAKENKKKSSASLKEA